MSTPFLSVIIPCYNASQTIINSLLCFENEFSCVPSLDWEIIVVNDGSTDQTTNAVLSLNNPRIKYFEKNNSGVSNTRNFGLSKAKGKYVWFFDADDLLFMGVGIRILSILKQSDADILRFSSVTEDYTNRYIISKYSNISTAKILYKGIYKHYLATNRTGFACWSLIVRRQLLLDKHILFNQDLPICEDVWWNLQLAMLLPTAHFICTDLNVVRYIVNPNSTVNTQDSIACRNQLKATCEFYNKLQEIVVVPNYLAPSILFWKHNAIDKAITRFLSSRLDKNERNEFVSRIQTMIKESGTSGKIVKTFMLLSKIPFLLTISQSLYRTVFLAYIKPRLGRN